MKIFDTQTTRDALPFDQLIDAIRRMFVAGCEVPLRHSHTIQLPGGASGTTLLMPAWRSDGYYGVKTVNIFPGNAALGLPGLHSTYLLYDSATGRPLAQIDGNEITSRRTVAASALAASFLARPDARTLLVVGTGRVARLVAEAYRAVLPIEKVWVWGRQHEQAVALAAQLNQQLKEQGVQCEAAPDLAAAVRRADVVSCATLATSPLIQGGWLHEGSHLDLIGGFTPSMREADDACFAGASLFVDTGEALLKSGDLLGPISRGVFAAGDVRADLAQLCRKSAPGRQSAAERTVFKSVGTALEDLAAASLVYQPASAS
ncbi:MAG: ornithine cyclodeaminase family protein [Comamonadaceae bacterium]|nr:MAG: ornithine cyclodeaminase family protein [Comamonadaceae bacterium]